MSATLERLRASDPIDAIEQVLKDGGGVIVEGLLAPEVVAAIKAEVAEVRERANPGMKHLNPGVQFFYGDRTRPVNGLAGTRPRTRADPLWIRQPTARAVMSRHQRRC
jgi:hypothetical protein